MTVGQKFKNERRKKGILLFHLKCFAQSIHRSLYFLRINLFSILIFLIIIRVGMVDYVCIPSDWL